MSEIRIEGADSVPAQPMLVLPNRVDLPTMLELEKALGGHGRVAWMVEKTLMPGKAIMNHLYETQPPGFSCLLNQDGRESIIVKARQQMERGRHVVLLPGRPVQAPGCLSDVPAHLLSLFDTTPLHAMPVYVGMYNNYFDAAITTREPYDRLHISFCPPLRAGSQLGARVQAAWMNAQVAQLEQLPMLEHVNLAEMLVEALLRNPKGRLIDGIDDSTLCYRDILSAAVMATSVLEKHAATAHMGIILPPGKLATIANLACLLAGITAVNINYTATKEQFEHMVKQAGLTRFLTDTRFVNKQRQFCWPHSRDLIYLDQELAEQGPWKLKAWNTISKLRTPQQLMQHARVVSSAPETVASIIFTGGTEDKPLGVPITHRMLLAGAISLRSRLELNPGHDILLSVLPAYTPAGLISGLLLPLLGGYDMVTYPTPTAGKRLCTLVHDYNVALTANTPAGLRAMLKAAKEPTTFAQLHYCLSSGSKLPADLAEAAQQRFGLQLLECYSTAEVLPFAAAAMPAPATDPESLRPVLPTTRKGGIGAPLPGVAVRITGLYTPEASPTPGNPGLVWLKGPAVTRSYLGVENEDSPRMHGNWFCTGDVGYMTPDGLLTILGRKVRFTQMGSEMIPHVQLEEILYKIFNVTPEENERKLAVVSVPSRTGGEELIMLSTLHKEVIPSDYLTLRYGVTNLHLPSSWAPKHIIPVKYIPTLPNGKLDYQTCFLGACRMLKIKLG
ncbi:MAG: AMP-binding protein [Akkermansia sp.]|nr:AMP-binding protein [Akkermansia sp.]